MAKNQHNLYRRNGTYYGRVVVNGQNFRRSFRTSDLKEARAQRDAWVKKLRDQIYGLNPPAPCFRTAVVRWIEEVLGKAVKPQTARRYKTSIVSLDKKMGQLPVDRITTRVIADYISSRSRQVSNATLKRDVTALSRLLSACVAWGWITDNPAKSFDRSIIRERRDPIKMVREQDYKRVLAELPPPLSELLRLLSETGMRLNEAATMETCQIDETKEQIMLTRTKTNRPRVIPWKTHGGDCSQVVTQKLYSKGSFLITNREGEPYGNVSSNFNQIIRRLEQQELKTKAGFQRFRIHDLRHMFAIRWLQNGGNIYRLSKHLGHTSVKTTEIYLDYLAETEQEAARYGESEFSSNQTQIRTHRSKVA